MPASAPDLPSLPSRSPLLFVIGGFVVLLLGIYGASLSNGFVRWDDGLLIYENPAIRHISPSTLKTIFTSYDPELYIPLTFFSYQIDFLFGGMHAFVYHLQNLLWHGLNTLLVTWLAFLLTRRGWAALTVGLLFAVHPLQVEAVAWAAARKDVLSTFFFLSSIIGYLYARARVSRRLYWFSVGLFLLGLLAKVSVITLPLVLLLIDDLQGRTKDRKMLTDKLPYFVLAVVFGIVAVVGKQGVFAAVSPWQMLLLACRSTVFYLQALAWPAYYDVLYPFDRSIAIAVPEILLSVLIVLGMIALALVLYRRQRWVFFGVCFYLLTLAPTMTNLIKANHTYLGSDRYAYIPSIAVFLLVAYGLARWVETRSRQSARERLGLIATASLGVLVVGLAVRSHVQAAVWRNSEALFLNVLARYPDSDIAHNNLGNVYRRQGRLDDAMKHLQAALASAPADAKNNIANVLRAQGDLPAAEKSLQEALAAKPNAKIYVNLGAVYRKQGKMLDALAQYEKALALDQQSAEAQFGLGIVYAEMGETQKALDAYAEAIKLQPLYADVYVNRGALHVASSEFDEALADFQQAIEIAPDFSQAHYNLAVLYEKLDQPEQAKKEYEATLRVQDDYTPAHINLGLLLHASGDTDGARRQFQAILRYDPQNRAALSAIEQLR